MEHLIETVKCRIAAALLLAMSICLTACATLDAAPVSQIEAADGAFTLPYRISSSGRFLIDVSIDGGTARPMSVDTGATVSVIYSDFAQSSDLKSSERTLFVRGLVGAGDRPVIDDVDFQIGPKRFALDQIVLLGTPLIRDEAVGLIGNDILEAHIVVFDVGTSQATFAPRDAISRSNFTGWTRIPLRARKVSETNTHLYFAESNFGRDAIPVLIDTGSNLNFINWTLAKMDSNIRRMERRMQRDGTLQGALESTSATTETVFYDLKLGRQSWDEISVVVTSLSGLASIAPTDEPMMVAGAELFTSHTVAFDLKGRSVYILPDSKPLELSRKR